MIIYLAGKIAGDPGYKRKFDQAEERLQSIGHTVLNPAVHPAGLKKEEYMRLCFGMIDAADCVALLPDWERSPGAKLERAYCDYVGKQTYLLYGVLGCLRGVEET